MMTLSGRVVKVEDGHGNIVPTSSFQLESGKDMMGEIIDIVDVNEMDSIEEIVRRQSSGSRATPAAAMAGGSLTSSFVESVMQQLLVLVKSGEDSNSHSLANISQRILQKQRSLQCRHAQEHQKLLQKQNKDWMWFHSHSLGERSLIELETIHQRECTEMHSRQQTEQKEMFDFVIFDCIPTCIKNCHGQEQQQEHEATSPKQPELIIASSSFASSIQHADADIIGPPDSSTVPERVSTDLQKAAEIKAVMRNRSMTRDERQNELIKIKERYAAPMVEAISSSSPVPINNVEKNGGRATSTGNGPSRWEIMVGGATPRETDDDTDREKNEAHERVSRRWGSVVTKVGTSNLVLKVYGDSTRKLNTAENKANVGDKHAENIVPQAKESRVSEPSIDAAAKAVTDNNHNDHPLDIATNRDSVKQLVPRLNRNDPSLTVLKLDGRKQIKSQDWQSLFESLEGNTSLTHLSIARCDLNDSLCVALMLALVENETLIELRLSSNKVGNVLYFVVHYSAIIVFVTFVLMVTLPCFYHQGLTDETGKGLLKVLKVNTTLKAVNASRTKISKQVMEELDTLLDKRNSKTRRASIQDERQNKIKELLSFSASDKVKMDHKASKVEEEKALDSISSKSKMNTDSSKKSGKSSASSIKQSRSTDLNVSSKSMMNKDSSKKSLNSKSSGKSDTSSIRKSQSTESLSNLRASTTRRRSSGDNNRNSVCRASITAKTMAQLGGDNIMNVGVDMSKLREQRKFRGECESCGQKCFTKTMFKTTPLTIPNLVNEGRCLRCEL